MRSSSLPGISLPPSTVLGVRRDGRPIYLIAGGAPDGDEDDQQGSGKPDTGDTETSSDDSAGDDSGDDGDVDWKAEVEKARADAEKWKAQSRKHEARAKENAAAVKERDQLRRQTMTDQEKSLAEAAEKARAEERSRLAPRIVRQGFLAAAAGRIPNASSVADDLNLSRFVDDDGEVDEKGLAELVERLAPPKQSRQEADTDTSSDSTEKQSKRGVRGFDQGARGARQGRRDSSVAAGRELWAERKQKTTI